MKTLWRLMDGPARAGAVAAVLVVLASTIMQVTVGLDWRLAANIALVAAAALSTVFAVLYVVRSPWWTHRLGRVYAAKCVVLSLVLAQIVLSVWGGLDYPGRHIVRYAIYAGGAVVYIPLIGVLLREQARR